MQMQHLLLLLLRQPVFWDATWPHVLVVHPVHACDPVQLLPGLQAAEMAMVLFQHHLVQATNLIAV